MALLNNVFRLYIFKLKTLNYKTYTSEKNANFGIITNNFIYKHNENYLQYFLSFILNLVLHLL